MFRSRSCTDGVIGPLSVPVPRGWGETTAEGKHRFPRYPERHPGSRNQVADSFFGRSQSRSNNLEPICGVIFDQSRAYLRIVSAKRADWNRRRCRSGFLGSGKESNSVAIHLAPRLRLHSVRRYAGYRLASANSVAREDDRFRW